ncbi:T6SS phospholipase effector Tle1-like catalytic domain-containing protein [Aspergillus stella-maris]|uniref:T6SS phospholipase effector Tle1-like catalytic domain-containing protein n=1 Tax=Aspergillus stella-maris TaxID=1810926 RepID=UPI003CCC9197
MEGVPMGPSRPIKQFVLCFDGTGNKFAGDESDSNVLKIFRMLDRSQPHQFHYYQPGIGTYVTSNSLSHTSRFQRIKSAYQKAKDSAIGSSFDEHVMGGYKFLMRFYNPGDEIYFIGFSRGAYIARFLAEMLDFIGLLEAGNEELTRFAWKTFAKWQQRGGDSEEEKEEKQKLFRYMKAFRETFSRPITRIRFMGLFDTVNSVPRFESAWMQRSKFPYTARSSAKVIRHAVGIDERRAKFRQDLISEVKPSKKKHEHRHPWAHPQHLHRHQSQQSERPTTKEKAPDNVPEIVLNDDENVDDKINGAAEGGHQDHEDRSSIYRSAHTSHESLQSAGNRYRATSPVSGRRTSGLAVPKATASTEDLASIRSGQSGLSLQVPSEGRITMDDDDDQPQDIQEVWFPGGHADIGGGWTLGDGESWALSHAPLVWMVQEAQAAGLEFDPAKMKQFECLEEFEGEYSPIHEGKRAEKSWCQDPAHEDEHQTNGKEKGTENGEYKAANGHKHDSKSSQRFKAALYASSTEGLIHDALAFGNGLPPLSVISWRIMEYLPFRRMDLREDGSWEPIRWPLPCGEVRDMPHEAQIHVSAIRRMKKDPKYRPGNLILGGGGRGVRFAPEDAGIGKWVVKAHEGDPVREIYVRESVADLCREEH